MMQQVALQWPLSSFYGWGVYGLNLVQQWELDPEIEVVCTAPFSPRQIQIDPLRRAALAQFFLRSQAVQAELAKYAGRTMALNNPVLIALSGEMRAAPDERNVALTGMPSIGMIFFESPLDDGAIARARNLPMIVTGSSWNEQVLRSHGVERVRTVLQGIDPAHFHPGPRLGLFPGRFVVFSGGKVEDRKAQDLVLAAFRIFAARHAEALLVTAWHSPFPQFAASVDRSGKAAPVAFKPDGSIDVAGWAAATGIAPSQFLDLGAIPNTQMAPVLREMDVGLFPNRCEGGTNLVAMECMGCGVPVILAANSGQLDLIRSDNCYPLERQAPLPQMDGWGESDVDEIVARLEQVFGDREEAARRGAAGAALLATLPWKANADGVKRIVREVAS